MRFDVSSKCPIAYIFSIFFILFIMPLLWPLILLKVSSLNCISKHIIHPIKKPWDFIFGKKEAFWIIVTLKNGTKIGGKYDSKSFASSFPAEEQIYLEEVWRLDESGKFVNAISGSKGILISGGNILAIEFLREEEVI